MLTRLRHSRPVGVVRYHLYRDVLLAWPRRHHCNICHWRGRRFLTYYHPFVLCPSCGASVRHRLIAAALAAAEVAGTLGASHPGGFPMKGAERWSREGPLSDARGAEALAEVAGTLGASHLLQGRVLHVSPEYCLGVVLRRRARTYVRADFGAMEADVRQDMTRMPFLDGSFDVVVACDTLEHVQDDRLALAECRRILKRGGLAIVTVPQFDEDTPTLEDAAVTTDAQRAARYGQPDHVRNYGSDFGERLAAAGFRVTCIDANSFDAATVAANVLRPPVRVAAPWGWNERRVYFAQAA